MADNIPITAGTGTTVSTEEVTTLNGGSVTAQHLQRTATAFRTGDGAAHDAATGAGGVTSGTQRMTLASDDPAVTALGLVAQEATAADILIAAEAIQAAAEATQAAVEDTTTPVPVYLRSSEYEPVAASATDQVMGPTGGVGDTIAAILVIPATTSPGAISIEDGATNTTVFAGGASSVSNLVPFVIPLFDIASASSGWKITTGADVSCLVFGNFT